MEVTMATTYQCCFCGMTIQGRTPDVAGLLFTTAIDGRLEGQHEQHLFCHTNCLQERLHKSALLYVVELCEADDAAQSS